MTQESLVLSDKSKEVAKGLFTVKDGSVCFTDTMTEGGNGDGFVHSPLQQLWDFYNRWGSVIPPKPDALRNQWERKDPSEFVDNGVIVEPELTGFPIDIFHALEHGKTKGKFWDFVKNSGTAKLLGAISTVSLYDMMCWLKSKGFNGKLEVYDVSKVPLNAIKFFRDNGLLPNSPTVELKHKSVLEIVDDNSTDLALSDVLGYYLTPENYNTLTRRVNRVLKPRGVWLTRELIEPNGQLPAHLRTVRRGYSERLDKFNDFIESTVGLRMPDNELAEWEATRWLKVPTYARRNISEYFSELKGFIVDDDIRSSSVPLWNTENKRVFETLVLRKQD